MNVRNVIILTLLLTALLGCKKNSNDGPTVIKYELLSTNTTAAFDITYTNNQGQTINTVDLAGWKLEFTAPGKPFIAGFKAVITTTASFPVTLRISVNGTIEKENMLTTVSGTNTINVTHIVQ